MDFGVALCARFIVNAVGVLLNSSLVIVTFFDKNLHSRCHFLIALEAFLCAIYLLNTFVTFFMWIFHIGQIPLWICCTFLLSIPNFGIQSYCATMLLIAIDRFISLLFPFWYGRQKNDKLYLIVAFGVVFAITCIFMQVYFRWNIYLDGATQLWCDNTECNAGPVGAHSYSQAIVVIIATVVLYCLFIILLYCRKSIDSEAAKITKHLFKALTVLIILIIFGILLSGIVGLILTKIELNPNLHSLILSLTKLTGNAFQNCDVPVLLIFSKQYRQAYKALFARICKKIPTVTTMYNNYI